MKITGYNIHTKIIRTLEATTIIIIIAIILYVIFLLRIAYKIIMSYDDCNPIKASSWIFVITFIPILGLLAHVVVGRNLRKKKPLYERLREEADTNTIPKFGFEANESTEYPSRYYKLKKLLTKLSHMPVFPGNKIEFFSNGRDKFNHLFADIENAKEHIHILYYTFGGDEIGTEFANLIIKKHQEGVKVRLIYDDVGSDKTKRKFFKALQKQGIEVSVFSQVFMPKLRVLQRINYRNHRKIVIIDGKIAYTGGMNVKDEYIKGVSWGIWRDLHMRIKGPAAQGLQAVFIIDWYYSYKEYLSSQDYFPPVKNYGNVPLQVVTSEALGEHRGIMQGMFQAITRAKRSIYIQTPYFVPSDSIMAALQTAALSGIEVHMILPGQSDNKKVQYAANSYIQQLLSCKIKVYQYFYGFIHSKLMIIDDELTIAGSCNMDIRSFELNFECSLFIYDKETACQAKAIFMRDMENCKEIDKKTWKNRPKKQKFTEAFFRLFSPFL